jgi:adenosylhomocysteine nucleosidase
VITGIVVALLEELDTLSNIPGYRMGKKIAKGSCEFVTDSIVVAYSGTGSENAALAAELLVSKGASRLISWGCAAALSDFLKPGDLALADLLVDASGTKSAEFCVSTDWHRHSKLHLSDFVIVHTGCLAESKFIVSLSEDKKKLNSKNDAIALDMESIAIAKVAARNKLSFLVIRAIADPVTMDLPKSINYALNTQGDIVLSKLLFHLACHPAELPGLIRLGLYFNAAKKTLKLVARQLTTILDFNHDSNQQPV